ncbi:MAG: TonB-dependent receptor plug domain-containing protein [bacterium]
MKSIRYKLCFLLLPVLFLAAGDICLSQEVPPVPATNDTSATAEGDSLVSVGGKTSASWQVGAEATSGLVAEDVGDYVLLMPGVASLDLGSLGQFSPLVMRGMAPQQGKVVLDGVLLEEPIFGSLNANNLPINFVESMTFGSAGPLAPLGTLAPAGVFEVHTFHSLLDRPYSKVVFKTGDFGYSDIGIIFDLPLFKTLSLSVSGNRQGEDGFTFNTDHVGSRIYTLLFYKPKKNLSLEYSAFLNEDKVEVRAPLLPDLTPQIFKGRRKETRSDQNVSLNLSGLLGKNDQLTTDIQFSRIEQKSFGDSLLFRIKSSILGFGTHYDLRFKHLAFSIGGGVRLYDLDSRKLGDKTETIQHLFLSTALRVAARWRLGLQGVLVKHEDYSAAVNPVARLQYRLSAASDLWVGVQRSRRYPSFAERFWPNSLFLGDADLSEERGTAVEIGFKTKRKGRLELQTAFFRQQVDDWIGPKRFTTIKAFGPANLGRRTMDGLDFKLIWNYWTYGQFGLVASYLRVEENASQKALQVPEASIYTYLEIGHSFLEQFVFIKLRLSGKYFGQHDGLAYRNGSLFPEVVPVDAKTILDGKITFQFTDAQFFLSMENMFDTRYQLVPDFLMPPRVMKFGVEWEFLD